MPFSKVLYPKMCSCSYHKASLTVTILTMSTKLRKAIYSLNQAPSAWYHELHQCLVSFGFNNSHADTSVFVFNNNGTILYLLIYVDDIIITGSDAGVVQKFIHLISQ